MTIFVGGNQIQLLRNGAEYFPALLSAINAAKNDIYLQTYIFQEDSTGIAVGTALIQAAKRGVSVNVLLDGFGSRGLSKAFTSGLEQAGVQVMFYRPKISPWSLKKSRLRRLHHKITVVDGTVGFVGGINIISDSSIPDSLTKLTPPRIDYAVRVEGKLLQILLATVQKLWWRIAWMHLRQARVQDIKTPVHSATFSQQPQDIKAALVIRDNVLHRSDIEDAYLKAIQSAKTEIIIANAYFIPGRKFRVALIAAAKRGVAVKLLLQGRIEYFVMFATGAFYGEFLSAGIQIYEYKKSFMHSKVAVIDGNWATVGSSNIDPFSLLLAREANILVMDNTFAHELKKDIEASIQDGAFSVDSIKWTSVGIIKRYTSWAAYVVIRLLLGMIGHSSEK